MRLEVRELLKEQDANTSLWTDKQLNKWLNQGAKLMVAYAQPQESMGGFTCELQTVNAGLYKSEYELPEDVDEIFGAWVYIGQQQELRQCGVEKALREQNIQMIPTHFYVRKLVTKRMDGAPTGITVSSENQERRGRTMFGLHPRPASNYPITYCYYSRQFEMRNDHDIPIIPYEYREGIINYCMSKCKKSDDMYAEADYYMNEYKAFADKCRDKMISRGQEVDFPVTKIRNENCGEDDGGFYYEVGWATS